MKTNPLFVIVALMLTTSPLFATEPIPVGDRACLFLDDRFIAEQSGLKRVWHQGQPRPEVAIQATEPWEEWTHLYGSAFRDPQDGLFKMYYVSAIFPARTNLDGSCTSFICYAESKDGKTWTKPNLGRYEDLGSKNNNIVISRAELANIFIDPNEPDPNARLKMFVYLKNINSHAPGGHPNEALLASGDGLNWKFVDWFHKPPYADQAYANYTDSHFFMWDSLAQCYRAYIRTWAKSHVAEQKDDRRRAIGISTCKVLNKDWTPTVDVLDADDQDDAAVAKMSRDPNKPDWGELYCMHFFNYGNHYVGLLSILYLIDGKDTTGGGDMQFVFSHDGMKWIRPTERITAIARSNAKDLFPTYVTTSAPIEIGDELWLYYSEANGAHPLWPTKNGISQIRAATWRRDGFVSMDGMEKGSLITTPLAFEGRDLHVNFKGESLRVSLLDANGKTVGQSEPLKGNLVSGLVHWKKSGSLSERKGAPVRLRFEITKGSLWSFRFSQ